MPKMLAGQQTLTEKIQINKKEKEKQVKSKRKQIE